MPITATSTIPSTKIMLKYKGSLPSKLKKSKNKLSKEIKYIISARKRNQTEGLKKVNSNKRFEPPAKNEWITSGKLGSRDAVLVFRTEIFDQESNKSNERRNCTVNKQSSFTTPNKNIKYKSSSHCNLSSNNQFFSSSKSSFNRTTETSIQRKQNVFTGGSLNSLKHLSNSTSSSENSISSGNFELNETDAIGKRRRAVSGRLENICDNEHSNLILTHCSQIDCDLPAEKLQLKYKFHQTETKLLRRIFSMHGLSEAEGDENFSIFWTGVHMKPDMLRNLTPYQRVNHFPRSYELTRKDRFYKNIVKMQHLHGMKYFDIVPQSFILPSEYRDLLTAHKKHRGPWIVKPAASSRGRGIFIVSNPEKIAQDDQGLVSKYVVDPLCIDGHKCDVRVYVLVTSVDPLLIYLYEEGLVRIATVKYERNVDNLWNPCMHLCNYSINKYHSDYIKSNDAQDEDVGHKWTLSALLRHLKLQGCDTQLLMLNIEDLIIKSILSCTQSIIAACRMFVPNGNNCFELYGFDILIDDSLKPWMLEINLSPSMGVDSPLDTKVKASMVTDLLTCVGIPAYSEIMRSHYDTNWTRFKNLNFGRRKSSVDSTPCGTKRSNITALKEKNTTSQLTIEEERIIRNARLQNARRGGFVRIFPTEDTMQRYGAFLDIATGIPMSISTVQGQTFTSSIGQHNYNQMLFNSLYAKDSRNANMEQTTLEIRMKRYERALENACPIPFAPKGVITKCEEEGKRLRKQMLKLIDNGTEFTQLQARKVFGLYLGAILRRLTQEPRDVHEKIILKFLDRIGGANKVPAMVRSALSFRGISKARSAMVAKLLGDFVDQYIKDTEAYVDSFEYYGMIPSDLFNDFLSQANEADLEAVLTLHTNLTGNMPYLYNRYGLSVPATPPIPSGAYGFLRALPAMVSSMSAAREFNKFYGYFKYIEKETERLPDVATIKKGVRRKY